MNVTKYSRNRFMQTLNTWEVPREYAEVMFNYFVHGFEPGSFFTAALANDFAGAMASSHPANSIPALKNFVGWLRHTMTYGKAWGDRKTVKNWLAMSDSERRAVLVEHGLVYSEQQEIMLALKNERSVEPFFMN